MTSGPVLALVDRPGVSYTENWSEQGFENHTVRQVVR